SKVNPDDGLLWPPLEVPQHAEVIELEGRADIIVVSEKGIRRINGLTGSDVWPGGTVSPKGELPDAAPDAWGEVFRNGWYADPTFVPAWGGPWLVRPAPDLNGDGVGDLVWASPRDYWMLAVSGKNGRVL